MSCEHEPRYVFRYRLIDVAEVQLKQCCEKCWK